MKKRKSAVTDMISASPPATNTFSPAGHHRKEKKKGIDKYTKLSGHRRCRLAPAQISVASNPNKAVPRKVPLSTARPQLSLKAAFSNRPTKLTSFSGAKL